MAKKNVAPVGTEPATSTKVKVFHMAIGVDLIGSKTSMAASANIDLEATSIGIRMFSKATGRTVVIPYPNVKGFELMPNEPKAK